MRIIPTAIHGVLDYVMGAVLVSLPWIMGFHIESAATWTPVLIGLSILAYSACTRYECGLVPLLDMKSHLTLDAVGGVILALSPWIFQFHQTVWVPHLLFGLMELAAAAMTQTTPTQISSSIPRSRTFPR